MGFRETIANLFRAGNGAKDALSDGAAGLLRFSDRAIFPAGDFEDMVTGGYNKNAIVFACIQAKVKAFNAGRFQIANVLDDEVIPNHPIAELIKNPNPFTSQYSFWDNIITSLDLAGISYTFKARNKSTGRVEMLWNLRPDTIKPVASTDRFISHYEQEVGASKRIISIDDMITIKYANPLNPLIGQPPLASALMNVATDNEATEFKKVMLQNRGSSPGIIISTKQKMTPEMRDKFVADWQRKFTGSNRGRPVLVEMGAMDIQSLSLSLKDMELSDMTNIDETRICMVLGVPPAVIASMVGLKHSTYSNTEAFVKFFYQNTIIPLQNMIDDALDSDLIIENDPNVRGRFDNSGVFALSGVRQAEFDQADKAFVNGWWTMNEARRKVGMVDVPGGDEMKDSSVKPDAADPIKSMKTQMETEYKLSAGADGLGLLDEALGRRNNAEKHLEALGEWATKEFKSQAHDVQAMFTRITGTKELSDSEAAAIESALFELQTKWAAEMASSSATILGTMLTESSESAAIKLGIKFDLSSEFQQEFIRSYRFKFAEGLAKGSVNDIRAIILQSQTDGLSLREISKALQDKFDDWASKRADMVARTETIRAANRGAENVWKSEGIDSKEWLPAGDACDWCESMKGVKIGLGEPFFSEGESLEVPGKDEDSPPRIMKFNYEEVQAPPLHPNCRCVLVAVFEDE